MKRRKNLGRATDIPNLFSPEGEEEYKYKMIAGMMRGGGESDETIVKKYPRTKRYLI